MAVSALPNPIDRETVHDLLLRCDDQQSVITDDFVDRMCDFAKKIQCERAKQNLAPYLVDDLRMVFHSAVLAAAYHKGERRHSGERVFESHLLCAAKELVRVLGRTRVAVLCAALLHDLKERKQEPRISSFRDFEDAWVASFRDPSDHLIVASRGVRRRVGKLIGAATKMGKDETGAKSEEQDHQIRSAHAVRKILGAMEQLGPDVLHVKGGGDRHNNMRTIATQKPHRKRPIAEESYEVYCRLADIFGMRQLAREGVDLCAGALNLSLLDSFRELRKSRVQEMLARPVLRGAGIPFKQYLKQVFSPEGKTPEEAAIIARIRKVKIEMEALSDYVLDFPERSLDDFSLSDLPICDISPMSEIVVIIEPGADIPTVAAFIERYFAPQGARSQPGSFAPNEANLGARLKIYPPGFGVLNFRVNDSVSEARSKRGLAPPEKTDPKEPGAMPPHLIAGIRRVLKESADDAVKTLPSARKYLLRPMMRVFTPHNDEKTLPQGATYIDFAAAVHAGFLRGLRGAVCIRSERDFEPAGVFDELEDETTVKLDISRHPRSKEPHAGLQVDPSWLYFCQTAHARGVIQSKFLRTGTQEVKARSGEAYVRDMARLFGLSEKKALAAVLKKHPYFDSTPVEEICAGIWEGEIDLLEALAQTLFKDRKYWTIKVELPNEPGMEQRFWQSFARKGVNKAKTVQIPRQPPRPHTLRLTMHFMEETPPIEMMKVILRSSKSYPVFVVYHSWFMRNLQRLADFFRLALDTALRE